LGFLLKAVALEPKDTMLHSKLGEVYIRLGKKVQAQDEILILQKLDHQLADDLVNLMNRVAS
jgi:Flp pilus assembly protein TadD